ncbi:MAG: hypothetical protein WDO12_08350 [Pseudomonadota bacterium]
MQLSPQDASEALDLIDSAEHRARERNGYREASAFLILWGCVWLVANAVTDLAPVNGRLAWPIATPLGTLATCVLVFLQFRRGARGCQRTPTQRALIRRRTLLLGIAILGFFPAMLTVLPPLTGRQGNAFVSLFWAFAYMAAGAWLGLRMFITGVVLAAAILVGYLFVQSHFLLWMAVVSGGSLLLAGFWLRRT